MVKSTFISFTQWECQNFLHIFKDGCQHIHQWCVDVFFKFTFVCVYCETSIFSYLEICLYIMIPKSVYSSYWAAVWTQLPGHRVQVLRATVRKGDRWDAMWTEWNFSLCGRKVYGRPHTDLFLTYCRKEKDFVLFIVMLHATWLHLFTRSCRALLRWATFCSNCSHLYQTYYVTIKLCMFSCCISAASFMTLEWSFTFSSWPLFWVKQQWFKCTDGV